MTSSSEKKSGARNAPAKRAPKMAFVNDEQLFQVIVAPHVSEKSTRLADKDRQVVFEVRRDASKPVIKLAVEKMFNVQVESVTLTNVKGKRKQTGRMPGRRQDWKKAYVRLKPGQDINFVGQQ